MGHRERTSMGGSNEVFHTTHWTQVLSARTLTPDRRREALETVITRYWKPVYYYLRRRGHDNETAKDLTQSFFHEVVLRRDLIQQADRSKGRLRSLLLSALDRYVRNAHRDAHAQKRMPDGPLLSLDTDSCPEIPDSAHSVSADAAFHYAWATELLDRVFSEVERDCRKDGLDLHWEIFDARVLQPILENSAPPSLTELCAKHGIEGETKASNMLITAKRRVQRALRICVADSVGPDVDVDEEISDLLRIFSEARAV